MDWTASFFINSVFLGFGLAMDAFTVSLVNGMNFPDSGFSHANRTAGTFAAFQAVMPMTGWLLAHTLLRCFSVLGKVIPWISAGLLAFIGVKMISERNREVRKESLGGTELFVEGIATSIDALSAGLALSSYGAAAAATSSLIIAAVTYVICLGGVHFGKRCGLCLAGKAAVLGGSILLFLAAESAVKIFI